MELSIRLHKKFGLWLGIGDSAEIHKALLQVIGETSLYRIRYSGPPYREYLSKVLNLA